MKYCKKCEVSISGTSCKCPLCFSNLTVFDGEDEPADYPNIQTPSAKTHFLFKLFLFLSVAVSLTCLLANLLCWHGILWSLIVVTTLLLVWETVRLMILSRKNAGIKVMAQTLVVLIVLITADAVTGWHQWSISIFAPFVIVAATFTMTIILYIKRAKWREYMLFQLIITANGFIPVIIALCGLTKVVWPGAIGALYALLTLSGMMIFADKQFKSELKRRFHV